MLTTPLPLLLRETMADFGMSAVDGWWADLDEPARGDVIRLWEETSFSQPCVAQVGARFVSATEPDHDPKLWHNDFYEYLVNHEICLLEPAPFHICTQHPAARAAVAFGFIPGDFVCPLAHLDCPMHRLLRLSSGKAVRLRITFTPSSKVAENADESCPRRAHE